MTVTSPGSSRAADGADSDKWSKTYRYDSHKQKKEADLLGQPLYHYAIPVLLGLFVKYRHKGILLCILVRSE